MKRLRSPRPPNPYIDHQGIRRRRRRALRYRLIFGAHLLLVLCFSSAVLSVLSASVFATVWYGALLAHLAYLAIRLNREQSLRRSLGEKTVVVPAYDWPAEEKAKRRTLQAFDGDVLEIIEPDDDPLLFEDERKRKRG